MSKARTWFTRENTPADINLDVLNRAARMLEFGRSRDLTRSDLVALRCAYRTDRSASDIVTVVEAAEGSTK